MIPWYVLLVSCVLAFGLGALLMYVFVLLSVNRIADLMVALMEAR